VVLVGDVGLNLRRADIYERELDFLVSTSYGPGRYDRSYEEDGLDYPIGYVRWTENRNMSAYLDLLAEERVRVTNVFADPLDLQAAAAAYAALERRERLGAILRYPRDAPEVQPTRIANPAPIPARSGVVRLAIVGAGAFTKSTHLPLLRELSDRFAVSAVAGRGGPNAQEVARQFGARYATSDWNDVLGDPEIDAVLIATRHDLHAAMALRALQAGKHVLLEKPLALRREELDDIRAWFAGDRAAPVLLTGYNRRFSPPVAAVRAGLTGRTNPMILNYRLNAGRLPDDHWVFGAEGGGRNLGEACHVYDLFTSLAAAAVEGVSATAFRPRTGYYRKDDNFVATLRFADGSVASLVYTALGSDRFPKERLEVFCDGMVIEMDDYREIRIHGRENANRSFRGQQKGWREELEAFHAAVTGRSPWPIPLWEQLQSADIALEVEAQLQESALDNV
jgi:predicted dehydrogenase